MIAELVKLVLEIVNKLLGQRPEQTDATSALSTALTWRELRDAQSPLAQEILTYIEDSGALTEQALHAQFAEQEGAYRARLGRLAGLGFIVYAGGRYKISPEYLPHIPNRGDQTVYRGE